MEAGTLSKANEFLVFQRDKMNKSVAVLQAKGLILDSAALLANVFPYPVVLAGLEGRPTSARGPTQCRHVSWSTWEHLGGAKEQQVIFQQLTDKVVVGVLVAHG